MIILVDNGHGSNTPGKCSPQMADGTRYREHEYSRIIAAGIVSGLKQDGYDARLLVSELTDISLSYRVRRVNEICGRYGKENVLLVSIHSDAAGCGEWTDARGWSIYTSPGQTAADNLATEIYNAADRWLEEYKQTFTAEDTARKQRPMRADWRDGDPDLEAKFYILIKTKCAAVLSENLFHDNKKDVEWLLTDAGKTAIINTHIDGIKNYLMKYAN